MESARIYVGTAANADGWAKTSLYLDTISTAFCFIFSVYHQNFIKVEMFWTSTFHIQEPER